MGGMTMLSFLQVFGICFAAYLIGWCFRRGDE